MDKKVESENVRTEGKTEIKKCQEEKREVKYLIFANYKFLPKKL